MDDKPSQNLQLQEILVGLEDEHKHLKISLDHLKQEVQKREVEIQTLLAKRELELAKEDLVQNGPLFRSTPDNKVFEEPIVYTSIFTSQVGQLLERISQTAEEVSSLVKL